MHETKESARGNWKETLRFATPLLLIVINVCIGMVLSNQSDIKTSIAGIDDKLFKHLTNDEMHSPRSVVVTKPEFTLYQEMRESQLKDIRDNMIDIKVMLKDHTNQLNKM